MKKGAHMVTEDIELHLLEVRRKVLSRDGLKPLECRAEAWGNAENPRRTHGEYS